MLRTAEGRNRKMDSPNPWFGCRNRVKRELTAFGLVSAKSGEADSGVAMFLRRPFRVVSNLVIHGGRGDVSCMSVSGAMDGQQGKDAAGKGQGKRRQGSGHAGEGVPIRAVAVAQPVRCRRQEDEQAGQEARLRDLRSAQ